MPDTICWLHDEMLRPECVPAGVPAVFVFDETWIAQERLSLKRIVFMYECLLAIDQAEGVSLEIAKGDVVEHVVAFAQRHGASRVATHRSPLPRLKRQARAIEERGLAIEFTGPEPIVELPETIDLKRFSRYWRKAEKQVMRRD